jgi:hypothetical protein
VKKPKSKRKRGKNKYDITVKTNLSFDELIKLAVNTPPLRKASKTKSK